MAAPVALRGASLTLLHVSARLGAGSRAVAAPRACVRARAGASTLAAPALAGRVALRGVALPTLQARKPASGRAVAVSPVALFKQGKDSIQWLNVLCTIAACAAFIVPLVRAEASALYAAPTTRRTAAPRAAFTISRLRSAAARCMRCPRAASGASSGPVRLGSGADTPRPRFRRCCLSRPWPRCRSPSWPSWSPRCCSRRSATRCGAASCA